MGKHDVTVNILGDARNLSQALNKGESGVAAFGKKAEQIGRSMTTYVTLPLVAAGAAGIKWAGEMEDSAALSEEVFRGNAKAMKDWSTNSAREFGIAQKDALEYSNQFGLALQNIGKMSESESAKVSQTLVELSADLASAFGTSNEEAFDALRAALTGEYEQLKKFGVVVNETALKQEYFKLTGEKVTGVLSAQQKQQAALSLVMQGTSKVQGDFSRNIDGTTNSLKVAQASAVDFATKAGTTLLPAFNTLLAGGQGMFDLFMGLPEPLQQTAVYAGVAAAAIGPLTFAMGKLAQSKVATTAVSFARGIGEIHAAVKALAAARGVSYMTALGNVTKASAFQLIGSLNPAMIGLTAVVATAGIAWVRYQRNVARVNELSERAAELARETGDSFDAQSAAFIRSALEGKEALGVANDLSFSLQDLADAAISQADDVDHLSEVWKNYWSGGDTAVRELRENLANIDPGPLRDIVTEMLDLRDAGDLTDEEVTAFLDGMSEGAQGASQDFDQMRESLIADIKATESMTDAEKDHAIAAADGAKSIADLSSVRSENNVTVSDGTAATGANTEATEENAEATEDQTSALQEYVDTLSGTLDPLFAATDALLDMADAQADTAEKQKVVTDLEAKGAQGTDEYRDAVADLSEAQRSQVRAAADLESRLAGLADEVRTGAVKFDVATAALDRWVAEGKITQGQADATKRELLFAAAAAANLGRQHPTVPVRAETSDFWRKAQQVQGFRFTPLTVDVQGRLVGGILGIGGLGRRQYGGPVFRGKSYVVGEDGPEIVTMGDHGTVIPNDRIGAQAPAQVVKVEINFLGPVAGQDGARWVAEMVEQAVAAGVQMPRLKQTIGIA